MNFDFCLEICMLILYVNVFNWEWNMNFFVFVDVFKGWMLDRYFNEIIIKDLLEWFMIWLRMVF